MSPLERAQSMLSDIRMEQRRQRAMAGERLGVFARLRELARDERRVIARIVKLNATHAVAQSPEEAPSQVAAEEAFVRAVKK